MIGLIGYGETGKAIAEFVGPQKIWDPGVGRLDPVSGCTIIHVCVPPDALKDLPWHLEALWIIHTTTPVGMCAKLSSYVPTLVHAPIEGDHPDFPLHKWMMPVSGNLRDVRAAVAHLQDCGIPAMAWPGPYETTELAKLFSTLRIGWEVLLVRHLAKLCEAHGADFKLAWTAWTKCYNTLFDGTQWIRTVYELDRGPIGGHCILPNADLLPESWIAKLVSERGRQEE